MNTLNFQLLTDCFSLQRKINKEKKMDRDYFIREVKDNYAKKLEYIDLLDIMADAKASLVDAFMDALQTKNAGEIGIAIKDMIAEHIKDPVIDRRLMEEAAENYIAFLEDQKAEADENRRAA